MSARYQRPTPIGSSRFHRGTFLGKTPERRALCGVLALVMLCLPAAPASGGATDRGIRAAQPKSALAPKAVAPDRVIVKFKGDVGSGERGALASHAGARLRKQMKYSGVSLLEIRNKQTRVQDVIERLEASGLVEYAEPDFLVEIDSTVPDDPFFSVLWGLASIDAPQAWDTTTGDSSAVVMVIDTGVDYTHADLAPNIWVNPGEIPSNGIDDDGNGYVDDVHGINAILGNGDPMDDHNHGTHVAGTIGAVGNNALGVVGVSWNPTIMACKFLGSNGSGSTSDAIECFEYARRMREEHGVDLRITNNSWGGAGYSQGLRDAMQAADMLHLAAAGNSNGGSDNDRDPHYPSSYDLDNVLAVAATDSNDALAGFSHYGRTSVDLAAPGVSIYSTVRGNGYSSFSGTSMATPHVAGAAAVVWSLEPASEPRGVRGLLTSSVDPVAALNGRVASGGRLNLDRALAACASRASVVRLGLSEGFSLPMREEVVMPVSLFQCTTPILGAAVTITASAGPPLVARDDGLAPDAEAGDGTYTAAWTPETAGPVTVVADATFGGESISDSVSGSVIDVPDYRVEPAPFAWVDATVGVDTGLAQDDGAVAIPIGFDFDFYGERHSIVWASSNGHLSFGGGSSAYQNPPIPDGGAPNDLVAPYWDDLNPAAGGSIHYLLEGAAPERRLTVAWVGVPYYPSTFGATFEATLYERDGSIVFQYLDVQSGGSRARGASASVGIEDATGRMGVGYSYDQPVISNGMALRFAQVDDCEDRDSDGICDAADNCLLDPNPEQIDTDADGLGNACDADYDNDGAIGAGDFQRMRTSFQKCSGDPGYRPEADCDADDCVMSTDLNFFRSSFGREPGPSGVTP